MDGLRLWSLVLNGPFLSLYSQCWWAGWHEDDQSRACMRCPCPSFAHPPQSAACKLAANSLSALRLLFQNIFPPVHDILPPPPFLFSRDPQLCPFLLFSCELPLTFPAGSPRAAVSIVRLNSSRASSLRRPQCAASVLPRGPRPRPPPSRQWPPPLPGLPFIPPIGPLSRLPANPVVRWRGAALCAQDRGAGTSRPPAGQRPIVRRCTHGGALGSRSFLWGKLHEDQCSPGPRVRGTIVWAT